MNSLKTKIISIVIILLLAFFLGILMSKAEIFFTISIGFIWISLFIITVIVGIIDLIYKKRNFKIPANVLLMLTLAFIISLPMRKNDWGNKRKKCKALISHLDEVKNKEGCYPHSITDFHIDHDEIQYIRDSLGQSFILSYSIDGWHREEYSSKTKEWIGYE
ncbi:hypothetical protein [Sediminitomix flava]|uniref:Uncharacterized protein n=1 Tax=Sediminitomix flava TaxID=379075 RepID=A0A315YXC3_SEDFL|nr:hypothetical protein [Sediminitomix flava]PWJ33118.1 hypothetical protein BC781_1154 [Sediminitomix flava]